MKLGFFSVSVLAAATNAVRIEDLSSESTMFQDMAVLPDELNFAQIYLDSNDVQKGGPASGGSVKMVVPDGLKKAADPITKQVLGVATAKSETPTITVKPIVVPKGTPAKSVDTALLNDCMSGTSKPTGTCSKPNPMKPVVVPKTRTAPTTFTSPSCGGNGCSGCAHLRDDMTHIAVSTSEHNLVTIDIPMKENKRITVHDSSLVVEDKDFRTGSQWPGD